MAYKVIIDGDPAQVTVKDGFLRVCSNPAADIDLRHVKSVELFSWRREIELSLGADIVTIRCRKHGLKHLYRQLNDELARLSG